MRPVFVVAWNTGLFACLVVVVVVVVVVVTLFSDSVRCSLMRERKMEATLSVGLISAMASDRHRGLVYSAHEDGRIRTLPGLLASLRNDAI